MSVRWRARLARLAAVSRAFHRLWAAAGLSNLADGIQAAAFPLLALGFTDNVALVAGVVSVQGLPRLLVGLPAGVLVDRRPGRSLLVLVAMARVAVLVAFAGALLTDMAGIAVLYLVAFALGVGETVWDTAAQTAVPSVVAAPRLSWANGRLTSTEIVANEFVGPPVGAALVAVGTVAAVGVEAALLGLAAIVLARLPATPPHPRAREGRLRAELMAGARWLLTDPPVRGVTAAGVVLGFADASWFALMVIYTERILGLDPAVFRLLLASGAAGGVLGGLTAARVHQRIGMRRGMAIALAAAGVGPALLATTANVAVTVGVLALTSAAFGIFNVLMVSLRQRRTPEPLLGRVGSAARTVLGTSIAAGAAVGGVLAETTSLRVPFAAAAVVLLVASVAVGVARERR